MDRKRIPYSEDLGKRYGRLLVMRVFSEGGRVLAECVCDCGKPKTLESERLRSGNTSSCGCLHREMVGNMARKHGATGTSEWNIWRGMLSRCYCKTSTEYFRYGARGITVCDEWRASFPAFLEHVGKRPSPLYSIERLKNELGYEPGNVKWATDKEQARNTRRNRWIVFQGQRKLIDDWINELGLGKTTFYRAAKRLPDDEALAYAISVRGSAGRVRHPKPTSSLPV